jgi:hypothetical protein
MCWRDRIPPVDANSQDNSTFSKEVFAGRTHWLGSMSFSYCVMRRGTVGVVTRNGYQFALRGSCEKPNGNVGGVNGLY